MKCFFDKADKRVDTVLAYGKDRDKISEPNSLKNLRAIRTKTGGFERGF
jgi:hypothetical protein